MPTTRSDLFALRSAREESPGVGDMVDESKDSLGSVYRPALAEGRIAYEAA